MTRAVKRELPAPSSRGAGSGEVANGLVAMGGPKRPKIEVIDLT